MLPMRMDYARETGRGVGIPIVPIRFVWPYGGKNVSLCGSFTGWSGHYPMIPVEGCPSVFQTICNLAPGYHEYKFFVDGEWRYDERQPSVNGNYGTVNTLMLARESDYVAPSSSMDVDNEIFPRLVRVSDGSFRDNFPRISEADLEFSRRRISDFLSSHTTYELLPESGKVVALDIDLPVKQAFHILHEQGISVAPLWDVDKRQFVGVLSALDFILITKELGRHESNLSEEELETYTISSWKEAKSYSNRHVDGSGRPTNRQLIHMITIEMNTSNLLKCSPLEIIADQMPVNSTTKADVIQAGPDENLKNVVLKILRSGVSTVPIVHSSSIDASDPQLLHLSSLSGILKCICRYFRHSSALLPILQLPVGSIPLGTWVPKIGEPCGRPFAMLRASASLGSALDLLVQAEVSSIPIVDDNDSLLDIYSRSDITALAKEKVYTHINLEEMTVNQALQLSQDSSSTSFSNQRCHMCLRTDPLHHVMERLAKPGVRRLIVVEAGSKHVEGIITLSDVFRFLLA